MFKYNRISSGLAATAVLLAIAGSSRLGAQSSCTDNLFAISSSSGTSFPASGGSTTISWHKDSGGSNSCPSFVSTTSPWLTLQATNSQSTTGTSGLVIAPNPSSAARSGVISVQSSATDTTSFTITQTGSTLTADVARLAFSTPAGMTPASQIINVTASGGAVQIAAMTTSTGNWLSVSVSSATAPSAITVFANPSGLAPGTYQGNIQIFGAGLEIPVAVTLTVTSAAPSLSFNPPSLTISGLAGSTSPQPVAAVLKNTATSANTVFSLITDQNWLTASTAGVSTLGPGQSTAVTVTATAAALNPGTYTGHVVVQGTGASITLPVTLNVSGTSISALVDPISLTVSSGIKRTFAGVGQLAGDSANVAISVTQGANFLSADAIAKSPGAFGITIDATGLSPGTYSGALLVQCTAGNSCRPVPVQVIVTVNPGSGSLNLLPAAATLTLTAGSASPQTASISLSNDGSSSTGFTISSDQSWLTALPSTGTLNANQKIPIAVSASAAILPPGSYTGHVVAQGTGTSATYTVNLTVTGSNVTASPNPLTLTLPAATKQIFPGAVQLGGDSAGVSISVTQGNAYLAADALSQSPGSFGVTVDATKLAPGTYPGTLVLRCSPGCVPVTVSLSIVVTQGSTSLSFASPGAALSANAGSPTPQTTSTTLQNAGTGPGSFAVTTDQSWLSATPSSGTLPPGQSMGIAISAASQFLAPGSYTGHVNAGVAVFTVSLTVTGVSLFVLPSPAFFNLAAGTKQTFTTVQVLGGSGPVSIAVTSGSIWLSADQAVQAPGNFSLTIDATFLKPGSYSGTLSFTCQVACVPFSLPINLTVTSNSGLVFAPATISFSSYQGRPAAPAQTLTVKSSDGVPLSFTVVNSLPWLGLSAMSGTTPATLTLTPNMAGLTTGTSGNLTFTSSDTQAVTLLPVTLNVQPFTISATPNPLAVSAVLGQRSQGTLTINTADGGPASLQVSTNNFWLSVPSGFTAPGSLPLKIDASALSAGLTTGTITLTCGTANPCQAIQAPVALTVTNTAVLLSDTSTMAFPITTAGPTQLTQTVHLTSSDNATPIIYTIDPSTLPAWLSVSTDRLTTPATLTFSVPSAPSQEVAANVKVNSAYGGIVIAVSYTPSTGPTINSGGVVSAGGSQVKLRSGSWATIYGSKLSTTAPRDWGSGDFSGNAFPTSLDGVSVMVGGKVAFVRSISPAQINFQCPDGIGAGPVPVTVTNGLGTSNTVMANVDNFAPAFFVGATVGTRSYIAATETAGNGVIYIGPANAPGVRPAKAGENVTLWGTGFGPTTPNVAAGMVYSGAAALSDSVQILIDGVGVTPQFAGLSAAGLYQLNLVVPNLPPGDHKVTVTIGGVSTADGMWLSTQ